MPNSRPQRRVTRTFRNLSRRSPAPKNSEPPPAPPRPRAASWIGRLLRRRPPVDRPAHAELDALTAKERQELWDAHRQRPFQAITSLITSAGVLLGVAFTAYGLSYTAQTLSAAQEGQLTDRYTKAVEQLASEAVDVRLGAIYALQRLATDSPRDRITIRNLLAAFVRNHDLCSPKPPPKQCGTKTKHLGTVRITTDVYAALTIAQTLTTSKDEFLDLSETRFPHADLNFVDLTRANLLDADLTSASLVDARLTRAHLSVADLTHAYLRNADLRDANLVNADLIDVDLEKANLTKADLFLANLTGANLSGANLTGANLSGANLTDVTGMTADEIRKAAITDATTKF
ncbi:pentapeptide repeat-containing protein [Streptosporangium carneum]|uniref:pentapeptide repeat-containing protein n=1 Tax=Streptosporangium carneum TaxID=47481 RepID=UPI0022F32BB0|nr:pentapeptide repeat-containing protein [Streptosporangium carneum]